jgi:integrase
MSKLNALKIKSITKIGMHSDGDGLYLKVQPSSKNGVINKSWIFRWGAQGKNSMGLGSEKGIKLKEARELSSDCRNKLAHGLDPRAEREKIQAEHRSAKAKSITFKEASEKYIEIHKVGWKSAKHGQQWTNSLTTHAFEVIGHKACSDITRDDVLELLMPIWTKKNETATRVRSRIENILDWAIAMGYRKDVNVAVLKGNLKPLLPTINKRQRVKHHKAMHYDDIPKFFKTIKDNPTISARALVFCILTATRTIETRKAKWTEFDFNKQTWTIPKERMKRSIEHRVPLASQVCEFLNIYKKSPSEFVFHSEIRENQPISDMSMLLFLQRKDGLKKMTVHGFRSSFRDWAAEKGNFPREVCEQALAHSLKDQVEAAYQRGDYFEKRIELMQAWADYCYGA